jgi:general secretion pathway protein J
MSERRGEAGFTLVEAMVSLFVFSLIAVGCVAMLMQSVQSQRVVTDSHERLRELQVARALLASDLAQIVPTQGGAPAFVGGDVEVAMAFSRASAEPAGESGAVSALTRVEYRAEENRLVRFSLPARAGEGATAQRTVLADASALRVQFFDGVDWRDHWLSTPAAPTPRAVAIVATLPRYGAVRIQALVGL